MPRAVGPPGTLASMARSGNGTNVLKASQRSSTCSGDHRNGRNRQHDSPDPCLHQKVPTSPCRTSRDSRSILLCGLRVPRTRKPTRLWGRSVALVAQPHPKCPFQVVASARPSVYVTYQYSGSTRVLGSEPDYMDAAKPRSIRHLTYPYNDSSDGGSNPSCSRMTDA
jgi:hypothetical protein